MPTARAEIRLRRNHGALILPALLQILAENIQHFKTGLQIALPARRLFFAEFDLTAPVL
jgi:hypothetical protein